MWDVGDDMWIVGRAILDMGCCIWDGRSGKIPLLTWSGKGTFTEGGRGRNVRLNHHAYQIGILCKDFVICPIVC